MQPNHVMEVNRQQSARFVRTREGVPGEHDVAASSRRLPHHTRSHLS